MKHHVDGFAALVEASCEQLASAGESAAPLVAAVRGWWAALPASKGLAIAAEAEGSGDEAKPSMAALMDAATASGAMTEEALGGEAGLRKATQVLHTLGAMQERVRRVCGGSAGWGRGRGSAALLWGALFGALAMPPSSLAASLVYLTSSLRRLWRETRTSPASSASPALLPQSARGTRVMQQERMLAPSAPKTLSEACARRKQGCTVATARVRWVAPPTPPRALGCVFLRLTRASRPTVRVRVGYAAAPHALAQA